MESTTTNNNVTFIGHGYPTGWEETEITTEDTFMEEVESFTTFKIANFINTYWFPVLVAIGPVGNTLSFFVMIKPNNRKMSTCIYMAAISINDNIMMGSCLFDYLVAAVQIHEWNSTECKIHVFVALFALQNGTFQVLAMTLDKYIAIKWPHKAATYSTPRTARKIAMVLYVCLGIYNIPHLFISSAVGDQCFAYGISNVMSRVYSWFSFVLIGLIPFTVLIHMNFVIVKTVRNSRKMFRANDTNTGMQTRQRKMKSAENQVTIMLLLVTTLFFILIFPTYFRFIYLLVAKRDTPVQYATSMIIYQISYKLYATNSGINFFLYCISGQKFRNDLKEILCQVCCFNISHPSRAERKDDQQSPKEISTVRTKSSISLSC